MLLLVPALLLMAHVTAHTAIYVGTPRYGGDEPADTIYCGGMPLEVAIGHDGFFTRDDSGRWQRIGTAAGGLDHRALGAFAREWKQHYPHESFATVSAEGEIPFGTLVATLDTLRGPDCRLAGVMAGEEVPDDCLLWQAAVRDRSENLEIPEHRRGTPWPPVPPHRLDPGASPLSPG